MIAFLGRYGHQGEWVLRLPITELMILCEEVGNLLEQESKAHRMETDGV